MKKAGYVLTLATIVSCSVLVEQSYAGTGSSKQSKNEENLTKKTPHKKDGKSKKINIFTRKAIIPIETGNGPVEEIIPAEIGSASLSPFPEDLIIKTAQFMDLHDLVTLSKTSRNWNQNVIHLKNEDSPESPLIVSKADDFLNRLREEFDQINSVINNGEQNHRFYKTLDQLRSLTVELNFLNTTLLHDLIEMDPNLKSNLLALNFDVIKLLLEIPTTVTLNEKEFDVAHSIRSLLLSPDSLEQLRINVIYRDYDNKFSKGLVEVFKLKENMHFLFSISLFAAIEIDAFDKISNSFIKLVNNYYRSTSDPLEYSEQLSYFLASYFNSPHFNKVTFQMIYDRIRSIDLINKSDSALNKVFSMAIKKLKSEDAKRVRQVIESSGYTL
jgi:hypothetical protein